MTDVPDGPRSAAQHDEYMAEQLLRRVAEMINQARPMPLSTSVMVNKEEVLELLNEGIERLPDELRARLSVVPVGETVDLKVQRGKESQTVRARIGELEQGQLSGGQVLPDLPGAAVVDAEIKGPRGSRRAVGVVSVQAGSPAFARGLRAGDLIVGVNQRRVTSVQELAKLLRANGRIALNVVRGDIQLTIPLRG